MSITRERLLEIIVTGPEASGAEQNELARMALSAMDSEPVAWLLSGGGAKNVVVFDSGNAHSDPLREVTPLYRHAQPAPVVPDDVLDALQKVARIRLDLNDFDGDRRGIADCLGDAEEALIEVVNRRAAMLAAAPHDTHALNSVQSVDSVADRWIPVSERMPELGDWLVTDGCDFDVQLFNGEQFIPGFVWEDKITHWMPLPAVPQEVKGE